MKANICLLFPVTDDDVADWAIHQEAGRPIVKELTAISQVVHDLKMDCSFYYDSANFNDFVKKIKILDSEKCYLSKTIEQIKGLLFRRLKDVNSWKPNDANAYYAEWQSSICTINVNVPLLYKYAIDTLDYKDSVVINFNLLEANQDNEIHILKDMHPTKDSYPSISSLSLMETADDTIAWLTSLADGGFSLRKSLLFVPTSYMWRNSRQRIYRRIDALMPNTLWCYDFFHKDNHQHFEVYNEVGEHIGEADINGQLIPNSRDPRKSISHILHGR